MTGMRNLVANLLEPKLLKRALGNRLPFRLPSPVVGQVLFTPKRFRFRQTRRTRVSNKYPPGKVA
eukprot:2370526-Pyramimonas_sp.AAC.1